MEVKLYNRDLASPTLVADITERIQGLKFSTRLNGGYHICTFSIKEDIGFAWQRVTSRPFYRLLITDRYQTLWEGRLEDFEINQGRVKVTAYGYYANLSDVPYATAYNDTATNVLKAALTAACTQISSDQTNMAATGISIPSTAGEDYLDITPQELVEKLLAFSDATNSKWYFAIWENRVPWLIKRSTATIHWMVSLRAGDFAQFRLQHRAADLYNSAYAVYTNGGVVTRTANADNAESQSKYGLTRRAVVPNLGEVAAATAQSARDGYLADHKDIWPRVTNWVLGSKVGDGSGKLWPTAYVRAGQTIRIRDLIPASAQLDATTRDAMSTFYIVETSYDADRAELTVVPDSDNGSLDATLAREL